MHGIGQNHIRTVYMWYFGQGNHQIYGMQVNYRVKTVLASPKMHDVHM
jgi:hypothetical protein